MIREELILNYLDQTISAEDAKIVLEWAAENPSDFQLMKEIWEESNHAKDIQVFDTDDAWDSFLGSLGSDQVSSELETGSHASDSSIDYQPEAVVKPISRWKEWRPAAIAASLLVIAIVSYALWPRNYDITLIASEDNQSFELPDLTQVSLQKGAQIVYPNTFDNKEKRIVSLSGIATFDITPDAAKPFIVETSNSGVKALGTIFEVDASQSGVTGVENLEGLIRFFELKNEANGIEVKEGESFTFDGSEFTETTPIPEPKPIERTFTAPEPPPIPYHSVKAILNHIYLISNGLAVFKGEDFDMNKKIQIDLNDTNLNSILRKIQNKASVTLVKKDCSDCYEILKFRVR